MVKLYYDCPIEAAYMAKNFGVKFVLNKDNNPNNFNDYQNAVQRATNELLSKSHNLPIEKSYLYFYIHPDSLYIFEPIEGDLIVLLNNGVGAIEFFGKNTNIKYIKELMLRGGKIIQRNNKPFITPKNEVKNGL